MNSIKTKIIALLMLIFMTLSNIANVRPSKTSIKMQTGIQSAFIKLKNDSLGQVQMIGIISGITLTISGFATLILGNYIIYAIIAAVPALQSASYNSTRDAITTYVGIVLPLFGLVMMVSGFALILVSLGVLNYINRQ